MGTPRRRLLTIVAVSLLAFSPIAAAYFVSGLFTHPPWLANRTPDQGLISRGNDAWAIKNWQGIHRDPRSEFGLDYEDVEFKANDGSTLRGWFVPGQPGARTGVVTIHGGGSDRREYLRMLPVLHQAGHPVLLFDCREHGISDGNGYGLSLGVREHRDVLSAVRHLRDTTAVENIAVIGGSVGGASAILAAAVSSEIDAVIVEYPAASLNSWVAHMLSSEMGQAPAADRGVQGETSPRPALDSVEMTWWTHLVVRFLSWRIGADSGLDPIDVIHRIAPRPLLLMHGERDRMVPVSHAHALFARAGEPKELWIRPDGEHVSFFNTDPEAWSERVLALLSRIPEKVSTRSMSSLSKPQRPM